MENPTTRLYFEAHVTVEPVFDGRLQELAEIAFEHRFKVADLLMQKRKVDSPDRSRFDTFCTSRSKDFEDIKTRTGQLVFDLQDKGFAVWRYKIEDTLVDSNASDEWGWL